ncbi:MAG TPA: GAF domain-containing protein, partial [Candidatus Saccharimonadales bacterium]|nr:GAF domain-containing protein [Candidatus Saccharimonadales bacterium]
MDLPADPSAAPLPQPASGTVALGDLFGRIASTLRRTIPFETAELSLLQEGQTVRTLTVGPGLEGSSGDRIGSRAHYSVRLWPEAGAAPVILRDPGGELDPSRAEDRRLIEAGARSILALPLAFEQRPAGLLCLTSRTKGVFGEAHAAMLAPIADLIAVAAEHERLWDLERARQRHREKLEALLPALAEALDVRQVFLGMSAVIREIVPHDVLAFALLTPDRRGVRVQAATHEGLREMPEYRFSNEEEALDANWAYLLAHDMDPIGDDT